MTKKTAPLSDDSIIALALFRSMLDDLDRCADLIEGSKNKGERTEAIACLRSIIANINNSNAAVNSVVYVNAHKKGRTAAAERGGKAKADNYDAFPKAIIPLLIWDSLPKKGRPTKMKWLKANLDRILEECGYAHFIGNADVKEKVKRWMTPSQRPKKHQAKV